MGLLHSIRTRVTGTISRVAPAPFCQVVALTFDDGPHPDFTPRLLDVLDARGAKATFFVLGEQVERHPEIVGRMVASGHAVGCHSYDHPSFPTIGRRARREQIRAWERAMKTHVGALPQPKLFRPPFGHQDWASYADVRLLGYQVVVWNRNAEDWLDHDPSWLMQRLCGVIAPGDIVLMHDNLHDVLEPQFLDRTPTLESVAGLLDALSDSVRFVTVPELLRSGRAVRRIYVKPPDASFLARLVPSQARQPSPV